MISKIAVRRITKAVMAAASLKHAGSLPYSALIEIMRAEGVRLTSIDDLLRGMADNNSIWTVVVIARTCALEASECRGILRDLNNAHFDMRGHFDG